MVLLIIDTNKCAIILSEVKKKSFGLNTRGTSLLCKN